MSSAHANQIRKFVLVNYSEKPSLQEFHGKAIALDAKHPHMPFPALFIIHEVRVRTRHSFMPTTLPMPEVILWQDWILADGVSDDASNSFNH